MGSGLLRGALIVIIPAVFGCGGGGGAPEKWVGNLMGRDTTGPSLGFCDPGEFGESFTVTLDLKSAWNGTGTAYIDGTGTLSGSETVEVQSASQSTCYLEPATVTGAPLTIETVQLHEPDQYFLLKSTQVLLPHKMNSPSAGRQDVPVYELSLWTTTVSNGHITGQWTTIGSGSASGNSARGTFEFNRQGT